MLIGTWDISNAGAKQQRLRIGHHEMKINSAWNEAADRPVFAKTGLGWKPIQVELVVKGNYYEEIVANTGTILNKLKEKQTVIFDRTNPMKVRGQQPEGLHQFDVILEKFSVDEKSKDNWHILTLDFVGVEYGNLMIKSAALTNEIDIFNPGNLDTPVTLFVRPRASAPVPGQESTGDVQQLLVSANGLPLYAGRDASTGEEMSLSSYTVGGLNLTVEGMCIDPATGEDTDIIIGGLTTGSVIAIDGDTGRIVETDEAVDMSEDVEAVVTGGRAKIDDVEIWNLPSIKPGENKIKVNARFTDLKVQFRPRYF